MDEISTVEVHPEKPLFPCLLAITNVLQRTLQQTTGKYKNNYLKTYCNDEIVKILLHKRH